MHRLGDVSDLLWHDVLHDRAADQALHELVPIERALVLVDAGPLRLHLQTKLLPPPHPRVLGLRRVPSPSNVRPRLRVLCPRTQLQRQRPRRLQIRIFASFSAALATIPATTPPRAGCVFI